MRQILHLKSTELQLFLFRDGERFILRTRFKFFGTLFDYCIVWGARLQKAQNFTKYGFL